MTTVADTAFFVAALRAKESARPDALFRDPLAERLAGPTGRAYVETLPGRSPMVGWSVVVRTVLIDRFILEAVARATTTILNLGAGLDTRPYRLALPASVRFVEVDQAPVVDYKNAQLANETPRCRLERSRRTRCSSGARPPDRCMGGPYRTLWLCCSHEDHARPGG